jgi:hypothetical protein
MNIALAQFRRQWHGKISPRVKMEILILLVCTFFLESHLLQMPSSNLCKNILK